jgi:AraC family transcriptional regulator
MAALKKIEFINFGPYRIIGKEIRTKHEVFNPIYRSKYPTIPSLWQQCFSDGTFDTLLKLPPRYMPAETPDGYTGYMRDFCKEEGTFTYLAGFILDANTPVPEGFAFYDIPACTIANAWIEGEEFDIYQNGLALTMEAVDKNGYSVDGSNYFICEFYTDQRFGNPKNIGQKVLILDFYVPCRRNS